MNEDDFKWVLTQPQYVVMFPDGTRVYGSLKTTHQSIVYKLKQVDDTMMIKIKASSLLLPPTQFYDMDVDNMYKVFKSHGLEDVDFNYAKQSTNRALQSMFKTYFNLHHLDDLLYLYIFLHSNVSLLLQQSVSPTKLIYDINQLPPQDLLDDIYTLYNTLFTAFELNH